MSSAPSSVPLLNISSSSLSRWYIDTRALASNPSSELPLLSTLRPEDQTKVKSFYHLPDRCMSLASSLLKYLFIHRACHVPWDKIVISRTPAPHKRPCYIPLSSGGGGESNTNGGRPTTTSHIEFNVSHQASFVALAGCIILPGQVVPNYDKPPSPSGGTTAESLNTPPQIGIDITCTDDPARRKRPDAVPSTEEALRAFIDIFAEVFSARELEIMKTASVPADYYPNGRQLPGSTSQQQYSIIYRLRLFYTYWALKEAYIKMTGEALLASWLRELEFTNVSVPKPQEQQEPPVLNDDDEEGKWGPPETGIHVWLHGKRVTDVRIEVVAFETDYLVATAGRGGGFGANNAETNAADDGQQEEGKSVVEVAEWQDLQRVDIERDIALCASGECACLD
ncbi:hypothetical protein AJ80_02238 [Polytolypa hystricis UAMH7299]|uniref:holo-[acyl-carrier-protein] synthase n=1 Tax=Polytolypa hystricis (strain UAMH7299) TaxID=1447883 RepID=A0A2B7YRY9_POLH7|nr:hypothetical protein AJ80_02238 [Polytolypa hystricis UAMH7299]